MRPYEQFRTKYQARIVSPQVAMRETACNGKDLLLSNGVDLAFVLLPLWINIVLQVVNSNYLLHPGFIVVTFLIFLFLRLFNGARTPGMYIAGIRYASLLEYSILSKSDYLSYLIDSFWTRYKYNDNYEMLSYWFDRYHQSPPMIEFGIVIVKKRVFQLFLEDYTVDGAIYNPDLKKADAKILKVEHTRIFKDIEE